MFKRPSKMRFFKKDGEESNEEVTTFFDSLNLGSKPGGGGKNKFSEKDEELEDEEVDKNEEKDLEEDAEDESESAKLSPEILAMQEQLKLVQDQNARLMQLLEGKNKETEKEPEQLKSPFETEMFDNLAETMDWDDSERKAMKAFMQTVLDYQSQTTLTTATEKISDIVNSSMTQAEKKKAVRKQFFAENPKLEPVKDYVSTVAAGVLEEYKALGKPLDPAEILKVAASRAYKVLGIDPKAKGNNDSKSERDSNPAFPSLKGSSQKRNQKVEKTRNQKMITSMIDL